LLTPLSYIITIMRNYFTLILLSFSFVASSQLQITNSNSAQVLARKIVGSGVNVFNAEYRGSNAAAGTFLAQTGGFSINEGIVLTTGRVITSGNNFGINEPASRLATNNNGGTLYQDADLAAYANTRTRDACVLEFDFIPIGDSISVNFVFASEEYPDFNCTNFNDAFAFLISGPGFVGKQNIALVPRTNIPVTINSINNGVPGQNGNIVFCSNMGLGSPFTNLYVDNSASTSIVYDGYTKVLTAKTRVQPCQTYHIKLAIADAFDERYDSGVFIEANSFKSEGIRLARSDGYYAADSTLISVEGCRNATFSLERPKKISADPTTVFLTYQGTATMGVDYINLPSSITFAAGDTIKRVTIQPIADAITEGTETIKILLSTSQCINNFSDSLVVQVKDSFALVSTHQKEVCSAFPTTLAAPFINNLSNAYLWSNGATAQSIGVTSPNTYSVIHSFGTNCYNKDTFFVLRGDPIVNLGADTTTCQGQVVTLTAGANNGNKYLWNTTDTSAKINIRTAGDYWVRVITPKGCFLFDTLKAVFNTVPTVSLGKDTSLCDYDSLILNATFANASYQWSNGDSAATVLVTGAVAGTYHVTTILGNCTSSDTVSIKRKRMPIADAGPADITVLKGGYAKFFATRGAFNASYMWQPIEFLNKTTIYNPISAPKRELWYYLTVKSQDNCVARDSIFVKIENDFKIPNAFSPNGDGINDYWEIPLISSYIYANVQIFNRYGTLVYSTLGYEKPWDGKINGVAVPIGTYYYFIDPGNGVKPATGWLQIIR